MRLNVVKNTERNISFGLVYQTVEILCPFITRTIMQMILGAEYLGLNGLFSSIIKVLSMAEAGVGVAVVYSMYQPVAEDDVAAVCALLNLYRKLYRIIGCVILLLGLLVVPFLPHFISGTYPEGLNITVLYLIYLANAVLEYFMYAYMKSLIVVYQREDVRSRINTAVMLLSFAAQVAVLLLTRNYYLYLLMMPFFTILSNLWTAFAVHRMYPQYHCEGEPDQRRTDEIRTRVSGAFLSHICGETRNSFDTICLSAFRGLSVAAVYGNYYYTLEAVSSFMTILTGSLRGGVGNHVVTRSAEENYEELRKIDFVYMWIACWCTVCLLCLYQPFMKLWMGEEMMLPFPAVILFCGYFYLLRMGSVRYLYLETNGLWWEQRHRAIVESAANLILNFILGKWFGVYGIISATMITLFFCNFFWGSWITFKFYFGLDKLRNYFGYQFRYMAAATVLCGITYASCVLLPLVRPFAVLAGRGILCLILPNILWILLYRHSSEFESVYSVLTNRKNRTKN